MLALIIVRAGKIEQENTLKQFPENLKKLYADIAEMTRPKCGTCTVPNSCCGPMYCDLAAMRAEEYGVELKDTDHPKLRFMGANGCTVEPYLRPICAVHVCEQKLVGDPTFTRKYFALRDRIDRIEFGMPDAD